MIFYKSYLYTLSILMYSSENTSFKLKLFKKILNNIYKFIKYNINMIIKYQFNSGYHIKNL